MDLRDLVTTESSAFVDRLASAVEDLVARAREQGRAEAEAARGEADATLEQLRAGMDRLKADLDAEAARASSLEADLDTTIEAHRQVDAARNAAEEAHGEAVAARGRVEQELQGTRELLERARAEAERLGEALERETAQHALAMEDLAAARELAEKARLDAEDTTAQVCARFESEISSLRSQLAHAVSELETARHELAASRAEAEGLNALLEVRAAELAAAHEERDAARSAGEGATSQIDLLRSRADAAADTLRAAQEEHAGAVEYLEQQVHEAQSAAHELLAASVRSLDALSGAGTVDALFAALATELRRHLPRVAIFRVKGNHVEGERGAGLDDAVDMKKLVIPMGVDSLITKAITTGSLVRADRQQLSTTPPPIGGAAAGALAAPISFQAEPFAVVYGDSDQELGETDSTRVLLLARHATLILARLSQEVRMLTEMRDYAAMLVAEADQMFQADVDAGRPAHDRISRLRASIDCARQLYAQRAALEGASAAGLLEQQLASLAAQRTAFGEALASVLDDSQRQRTAS